ncbi:MAG: DedA family protein [Chloroflexota bacterium]|nr:DedA family protein [Chloroflexota bacterium]
MGALRRRQSTPTAAPALVGYASTVNNDFPVRLDQAWELLLSWFSRHEGLLIFLAILLEESGVPMPIPADVAMVLMGTRVAQGQMSLLTAFLIGQVATLIGSSILYWIGRRGGRPLLFRYGKLLHMNAHRIAQVERLVTRLGPLSVIIGRQIPGLRLAAPLACGVFRVPYRMFVPAMIVGSSLYIGIFVALGFWGGPAVLRLLNTGGLPLRFVFITVLLVVSAVLLQRLSRRAREVTPPLYRLAASRRRSLEAGLIAGMASSILTGLVVAWILGLIAIVAQSPPEQAFLRWLESTTAGAVPLAEPGIVRQRLVLVGLLATVPFQVVGHVVWAIVYALLGEPRLRGKAALRGLQFALVPWLFSGLVIFPLLDGGPFGIEFGAGLFPVVGETVRFAIYGVALGTIYRLVRLARQPRLHTGHRHGHRHYPGAPSPTTPLPQPDTLPCPTPSTPPLKSPPLRQPGG